MKIRTARTFASQKFFSLITANLIGMLVEYLVLLSDSLIAGNLLGEEALLAINLSSPFLTFIIFIGSMITIGTNISFADEVGRGRRDQAMLYFSQSLIAGAAAGSLLTLFYLGLYWAVPNLFGLPPEINAYLRDYLWYICLLPLPLMFNMLLYDLIVIEGGEFICSVSSVTQVLVNIGLSIWLCRALGIGGIGLGTLISSLVTILILSSFFLKKSTDLHLKWFLSAKALMSVMKYSLVDAGGFLFLAVMQMTLNIFLLQCFGPDAAVVFTVIVNLMLLFIACFDNLGEAIMPLIRIYRSEGGRQGIFKTMKTANRAALVEGLLVTVALWGCAGFIPGLFGISTPELAEQVRQAVRIYSLSIVAVAFIMLYSSYYLYLDRIALSLGGVALYMLVLPICLGTLFGLFLGLKGVWAALALSAPAALAICGAWVWLNKGGRSFPWLLEPESGRRELSYDVPKTKEGIMKLVYRLEDDLRAEGLPEKMIFRIMLMVEETEMFAIEKREEEGRLIECTVFLGEEISLILRDSGEEHFVMSEDAELVSLSGYVYTRLLASQREKRYILTCGHNRVIYEFQPEDGPDGKPGSR